MRYINRLEKELKEERVEIIGIKAGLEDLRVYLCSSKFYEDPTVQVKDVLTRLEEALALGSRLREEQERFAEHGTKGN